MSDTLRSSLTVKTRAVLKNSESFERYQLRNYFVDQESDSGRIFNICINYIMGKDGHWANTFEIVCVSIIYGVRIISIANMKGGL